MYHCRRCSNFSITNEVVYWKFALGLASTAGLNIRSALTILVDSKRLKVDSHLAIAISQGYF